MYANQYCFVNIPVTFTIVIEYYLNTDSNPGGADEFSNVKTLNSSSPGGTLRSGSRVSDFWLMKEPQAWKK